MAEANHEEEQTTDTDARARYELGYHVMPTVAEESVGTVVERLRGVIESQGGTVVTEGYPQKITLAYEMEQTGSGKRDRYGEAFFGWIQFEAESPVVPAIDAAVAEDSDILRHLLIRTTADAAATTGKRISAPREKEPESGTDTPLSEADLDKQIEEMVRE